MKGLAGLDEDLEFHHEVEAKVSYYKAARCFYIALAFLNAQKWAEAMALFQRAKDYVNKARKDAKLEGNCLTASNLQILGTETE